MTQRRETNSSIALWGNVLCQQLLLPSINWESQRDKYPFFRDAIRPSLFAQPNPVAFQSLLHFLFTILDPVDASEKFFGLWPLKSGDKKADSQFRSTIFRGLARLQKGEWSCAPNPKRAIPARSEEEAVAEANVLGPVLFDMRLAPSRYNYPIGEEPTALLAKLAHLVASVESIRQRGAETVSFPPTATERQKGKKNKRVKLRSRILASRADADGDGFDEALDRASDDGNQLHLTCQAASNHFEDLRRNNSLVLEQVDALANNGSFPDVVSLTNTADVVRSVSREASAQIDVLKMISNQKYHLQLTPQVVNSLLHRSISFPEIASMDKKLEVGKSVRPDEILSVSNQAWNCFASHIEKLSLEKSKLADLEIISQESFNTVKVVTPKMADFVNKGKSHVKHMTEFIDAHRKPATVAPATSKEHDQSEFLAQSSPVPSTDEILEILSRRFDIGSREALLEALFALKIWRVENEVKNDQIFGDDDGRDETLDETIGEPDGDRDLPLNRTLTSPSIHSPFDHSRNCISTYSGKEDRRPSDAVQSVADSFNALSLSGADSVFSPLIRPQSRPNVIHSPIDSYSKSNLSFDSLQNGQFRDESFGASFGDAALQTVAPSAASSVASSVAPSLITFTPPPGSFGERSLSSSLGPPFLVISDHSLSSLGASRDFSGQNVPSDNDSLDSASIPPTSQRESEDFTVSSNDSSRDRNCIVHSPVGQSKCGDEENGGSCLVGATVAAAALSVEPSERRWSSLGAKDDDDNGLMVHSGSFLAGASFLDDSDAFD